MNVFRFSKMHGAGNDFIVSEYGFTNEKKTDTLSFNKNFISHICDRHRGIGADGLIIISPPSASIQKSIPLFKMSFFNSDGSRAEMCGNGLRCAALYANKYLTKERGVVSFETDAGILKTEVLHDGQIQIQIPILKQPQILEIENQTYYTVNTGVPHLVVPVNDISSLDVIEAGQKLRSLDRFAPEGVNVDFIFIPTDQSKPVQIRTYERGVENETSACGTGIAAAAVVLGIFHSISSPISFMTQDKDIITIAFLLKDNIVEEIKDILLTGPSVEVFSGLWKEY